MGLQLVDWDGVRTISSREALALMSISADEPCCATGRLGWRGAGMERRWCVSVALVCISDAEAGFEIGSEIGSEISEQRVPPSLYATTLHKTLRRWREHTLGSRHCRRCRCRRLSLRR